MYFGKFLAKIVWSEKKKSFVETQKQIQHIPSKKSDSDSKLPE